MTTRRWAEGYLTGIARAHRRGNVTERAVRGSIDMARRRGVDIPRVQEILARHALVWDEATGHIRRMDQDSESVASQAAGSK
jgi:hypothetical protein